METRQDGGQDLPLGPHKAARPMKVVMADDGCAWLCDAEVDEARDLRRQGCWRCGDLAFTRDD